MSTKPTEYHRPDFSLEYEELPEAFTDDKSIVTPRAVNCCPCTPGNSSICTTENDSAHVLASSTAYIFAFGAM